MIFGNTDRHAFFDLSVKLFADKGMSPVLLEKGLVQFGNPYWYNYDPACFDTTRRSKGGECPIVQVDHEEILCNDRVRITAELFPSFREYAEEVVARQMVTHDLEEYLEKFRQSRR